MTYNQWKAVYLDKSAAIRVVDMHQNYKPVIVDNLNTGSGKYHNATVDYKKLLGVSSNLYLSNAANIKPRQQHNIDMRIRQAMEALDISEAEDIPKFIVVSDKEMPSSATDLARYTAGHGTTLWTGGAESKRQKI